MNLLSLLSNDIIKCHIIPYLNGFDLLYFFSTCKKYYNLYKAVEKIQKAFNLSNVIKISRISTKRHECGYCLDKLKKGMQNHIRSNHRMPKSMICSCYKDKHSRRCPLSILGCVRCKAYGSIIDLAPWKVVGNNLRTNSDCDITYTNYCINCIHIESSNIRKLLPRNIFETEYIDKYTILSGELTQTYSTPYIYSYLLQLRVNNIDWSASRISTAKKIVMQGAYDDLLKEIVKRSIR